MPGEGWRLRGVATDGHRLARMDVPLPERRPGHPRRDRAAQDGLEIAKLIADHGETVKIDLSANKIRFTAGNVVLTSKLIDGTFPDYQRVIPQGNDKVLEVENAAFKQAVDRVSTLSSEKGRAVKLNIASGRLVLSVNNPESGSATEELTRRIRWRAYGNRLQRSLSNGYRGAVRRRQGGVQTLRRQRADRGSGREGQIGPLRADADARLTGEPPAIRDA